MKISYKFADGTKVSKVQITEDEVIDITPDTLEQCLGSMISNILGKVIVEVIHEE